METTKIDNLLDITDAAAYLNRTRVTVYNWLNTGRLTAVVISDRKYIPREQLDLLLSQEERGDGVCP